LAVELVQLLCRRFPQRRFHVVADSTYGGQSVLTVLPANCDLTSRLLQKARLYAAAPARGPGQKGRPRTRGERLPTPAQMLQQQAQRHTLQLYGRRDRVRLHVCWGNYEGPHDRDVPLADILPILQKANVGGFVLPFANPRHQHEWRVLQKFPLADDQVIVAGVIDDLTGFVEHPEVVADRLENVARAVGDPKRVMAGTDCGFDTSAGMGRVTEDVVWAKLRAMSDGARIATQRLFGSTQ